MTAGEVLGLLRIALLVALVLAVLVRIRNASTERERAEEALVTHVKFVASLNPYAFLLGRVVEARVYEASRWERMVVVAVSWKGAICVRPEADPLASARWISKEAAPERVRMIGKES